MDDATFTRVMEFGILTEPQIKQIATRMGISGRELGADEVSKIQTAFNQSMVSMLFKDDMDYHHTATTTTPTP
jgi:citrate lyase synthetase